MKTEIGSIAAAFRDEGKKIRLIKRKRDGTASPHRYVQAWALTSGDFIGNFLGVNVGTPLQRKLSKLAICSLELQLSVLSSSWERTSFQTILTLSSILFRQGSQ
jgi:hypothetical protein